MKISCSCGHEQEYHPSGHAKRARVTCVACEKRFTVNKEQLALGKVEPSRSQGPSWQEKLATNDPRLLLLDQIDKQILIAMGTGESQAGVGRALGISRQAVWSRVKGMVKARVLDERPTYPRSYQLLPQIQKAIENGVPVVIGHDVGIRFDILKIGPKYEDTKQILAQKWMNNWWQRSFDHKFVHFDINETKTPNVFCYLSGAGTDKAAMLENVHAKALDARDSLEDRLGIILGDPRVVIAPGHGCVLYMSEEQLETLGEVWNDRSDPAAAFEAELANKTLDTQVSMIKNQEKLEQRQAELQAELDKTRRQPVASIDAIKPFMDNFQAQLNELKQATVAVANAIVTINTTLQAQNLTQQSIRDALEHLAQQQT